MYENICLEGGGIKGLALSGAARAFDEKGLWSPLKRFCGSSAGAIFALMSALKYTPEEIKDLMFRIDFNKFKDGGNIFKQGYSLFRYYGLNKGDYFSYFIKDIIAQKLSDSDATFFNLKQKFDTELFVIGSNLSTRTSEVFSYHTTCHMPLWQAVRISMSIPFFYRSVKYPWPVRSDDGQKVVKKECLWCDGGLFLNYPIQFFDDEKYCLPQDSGNFFNTKTIGFKLDSESQIAVLKNNYKPYSIKINNIKDFIESIIDSLLNGMDNYYRSSDDYKRTVFIDILGVGTTEFNLSLEMKNKLYESGYFSAMEFLKEKK